MTDGLIKTRPREDLTGRIFGRLTVLRQGPDFITSGKKVERRPQWYCECSCGNPDEILVLGKSLKKGTTRSCGCIRSEMITQFNKTQKQGKKYNDYNLDLNYGIGYTTNGEEFYFSKEDYDLIKDFCWYLDSCGYVVARYDTDRHVTMGRLLLGVIDEDWTKIQVDHKNGDKKDNRRENIRLATPSQNSINKDISKNNQSGKKGVIFNRFAKKWSASIGFSNKAINLGYFDKIEDAVKARKEAEEKYYGEFSFDNSRGIKKDVVE